MWANALFQSLHDNHSDLSLVSFCVSEIAASCMYVPAASMDNNNHLKGDFVNYYLKRGEVHCWGYDIRVKYSLYRQNNIGRAWLKLAC